MDFTKGLSTTQLDALKEIGNIGAGNAATSMSQLLNKKIDMHVPSVKIIPFDEVMEMIGGPENLIVAIMIRIQGNAPGTVFFILSIDEASNLVRQITSDTEFRIVADQPPSGLAVSALQEVGNILAGSYLSALSDFTGINMQPSVPSLSIDMAGAILTAGLIKLSQVMDYAVIIDTTINENNSENGVNGKFFLLPDPESFDQIFKSIGISSHE
ncbi:chemotaxis protein CheC [Virgibacillus flavescens]|uniref:chemotaxis protein CheC n=1 Tax=Virgibacillus flavescens TaxID=1611422 RepID=UPI003D334E26